MRAAICALALLTSSLHAQTNHAPAAGLNPVWQNAIVYFLMTDRFANGDKKNDNGYGRKSDGTLLRGFEGGDIAGVTAKIRSGYFNKLGVTAIWTTPLIENSKAAVTEKEWGKTYAYHGYWPQDWTALDANFGTRAEFKTMVQTAHQHGIRVLMDVIVNHAGVASDVDPRWPDDWVRKGPACDYTNYALNVSCELSFTLQDILTESEAPVELPDFLKEKWRREGRLDQELTELDQFFTRTKLPRAPKYYIVKWLTDWVREYGIDGFRVDTVKHTEADVWKVVKREAEIALADWRQANPKRIKPDLPFYMVGEVYNYGLEGFSASSDTNLDYEYGDRNVNFYDYGFDALINMGFPSQAKASYEELFAGYQKEFAGRFHGKGVLNYISSHDDGQPFDGARQRNYEAANKLLLAPGGVQIYYGDEIARSLVIPDAKGDATLRSNMDWKSLNKPETKRLLSHYQKLATFRSRHLSVGAGTHAQIQASNPYVFSRILKVDQAPEDRVVIALDVKAGKVRIPVAKVFQERECLRDAYSGKKACVKDGVVTIKTKDNVVLLEKLGD